MFKKKHRKKRFIGLLIILMLSLVSIPHVKGAWLTGWDYRNPLTVTGSSVGLQTDYQVGVKVYYGAGADGTEVVNGLTFGKVYVDSKCRTDFGDIRFTETDGDTELDYWMEEKVDSNYALFWVEEDSIPQDPSTDIIYIYYGKGDATTTSNGENTFLLFEDFEGIDLPSESDFPNKIGNGNSAIESGELSVSGGEPQYQYTSSTFSDFSITVIKHNPKAISANTPSGLHVRIQTGDIQDYYGIWGWNYVGGDEWELLKIVNWGSRTELDNWIAPTENVVYRLEVRCYSTSIKAYFDGTLRLEATDATYSSGYIGFFTYGNAVPTHMHADDIYVRKFVDPEPVPTSWGGEEALNYYPTITSSTLPDRDDGDNCYEMESYYTSITVVNDEDGADTISKVYLQGKQGGAVRFEIRATSLDGVPSYDIQTGATIIDLDIGSCSWVVNGNEGTLTLLIRFEWDFTDEADLEIAIYVEDTLSGSAGFTDKQTNYFDVIGRLVIYNLAVDDGRINLGGTATFSGEVYYSDSVSGNTPSSKYPLDAQFTNVAIHDSGHVEKGTDVTIVNGVFSGISFAIPSSVQSNTYHVYLNLIPDYSDADAPDGDTVAVIGDRIKILTLTSDVILLEVNEYAELRLTAELEFDNHPLGSGDSVEINGEVLTWDAGDSRFEVAVTSAIVQVITYNSYTDGLEATYSITAGNINGNSRAINFTVYPPSDPNSLFGAGFNVTPPYVELHWNHTLQKVSIYEIQNSTDSISWDYLGQSTTTNYTDVQVLNNTKRYYRVRACNTTDGYWFNSSFTDVNYEEVYFNITGNGISDEYAGLLVVGLILGLILGIGASRT